MKHYGNYHGTFGQVLRNVGLLDAKPEVKMGHMFPRPWVDKLGGPGSNNNHF